MGPVSEARAFVRAALVTPVERDHRESPGQHRRRIVVSAATLVVGAGVLGWTLRIEPGDRLFYLAGLLLAAVWTLGAVLSGPLHLGRAHTRSGDRESRGVVQALVLGLGLLAIFLLGGLVVEHIEVLRDPVRHLLRHARSGSLAVVAVVTAVNGIAEEFYFRGALYAALPMRRNVVGTAVLYTLVTAASGIVLLALAALLLGMLTALQRRVTGGILAPIVTHLVWSLGMLFLLPAVLGVS